MLGIYWKEITHKGFSLARLADVSVMSAMKKEKKRKKSSQIYLFSIPFLTHLCFVQSINVTYIGKWISRGFL